MRRTTNVYINMPSAKAKSTHFWADEETHFMLYQLREVNISKYMDGRKTRNGKLFRIVAERLDKAGFKRTPEQIRVRWKHLKQAYYHAKKNHHAGSSNAVYSDVLEELLGHKSSSNGVENGDNTKGSDGLQEVEDLGDTTEEEEEAESPARVNSPPQPSASSTSQLAVLSAEQLQTSPSGRMQHVANVEKFLQTMQQMQKTWLQQIQQSQEREERLVNSILENNAKMVSAMIDGIHRLQTPAPQTPCQFAGANSCAAEEHQAAAERTERTGEVEMNGCNIQQRVQDKERDMKLLQQEVEAINCSADEAVEHSERSFSKLICLMEKRRFEVRQQIRTQQRAEVGQLKELQEKLEKEISELQKLPFTQDQNQDFPSLSQPSESADSSSINICPVTYFEDVRAAVSDVRDKLEDVLSEEWTNTSRTKTESDVLMLQSEPKARAEFLQYLRDITLDQNTVNSWLSLSNGNKKVTFMSKYQCHTIHPDRFSECLQVLSEESLTGRCYWEVETQGDGVCVAVAYKDISRAGSSNDCGFGYNDKSWVFDCYNNGFYFWHYNIQTNISGSASPRVGVYLDHGAGVLSFYGVSDTMTLLHRVQTTFTQPLHAGIRFHLCNCGSTAEFCRLKKTETL